MRATSEDSFVLKPSGDEAIDRLFSGPAYPADPGGPAFVAAMAEAVRFHRDRCPEYRSALAEEGIDCEAMDSLVAVESLPWIFAGVLKEVPLRSVGEDQVSKRLTSSGTSGVKTDVPFDSVSLNRMLVNDYQVHDAMGLLKQSEPCACLIFGYELEAAPDLGAAWSSYVISELAPFAERRALIRRSAAGPKFSLDLAIADYLDLIETGRPMRWIGYPSFMHRTLCEIRRRGLPGVPRPDESWVQPAGGWKTQASEAISPAAFKELVGTVLGIPAVRVRDLFGCAEHGITYLECEQGRLHVPGYAHALARDVFTLEPVPSGEPGLLNLLSPMWRSLPAVSVITADLARVLVDPCSCHRAGQSIVPVRRLGLEDYETCAVRALRYMDG